MPQWHLGSGYAFLHMDDTVAPDCVLSSFCSLSVPSASGPVPQNLTAPPQIKNTPLPPPGS